MRTVNLRITSTGALVLGHPWAKPGPEHLIYAIRGVPDDVQAHAVVSQVSRITLWHRHSDLAAWSYEWSELAPLASGAILNRFVGAVE